MYVFRHQLKTRLCCRPWETEWEMVATGGAAWRTLEGRAEHTVDTPQIQIPTSRQPCAHWPSPHSHLCSACQLLPPLLWTCDCGHPQHLSPCLLISIMFLTTAASFPRMACPATRDAVAPGGGGPELSPDLWRPLQSAKG